MRAVNVTEPVQIDVSPTTRTRTILDRFPAHLQADDPGKLFLDVVDALSGELDVKSSQLGSDAPRPRARRRRRTDGPAAPGGIARAP